VDETAHAATLDAEGVEPGQDSGGLVVGLRRHLGHGHPAGRTVHRRDVGERAADVDPDNEHA